MAGRLLYFMGPSGAGKDTVLQGVENQLGSAIHIAPRIITRPCHPSERRTVSVTPLQFQRMQAQGQFAMAWRANDLAYGISHDIHQWLSSGTDVLVNGSRAYFSQACQAFPLLLPILLHVDSRALEQRLLLRGRENSQQIQARLSRNGHFMDFPAQHQCSPMVTIDNSGSVDKAIKALCQVLEQPWHSTESQLLQERA